MASCLMEQQKRYAVVDEEEDVKSNTKQISTNGNAVIKPLPEVIGVKSGGGKTMKWMSFVILLLLFINILITLVMLVIILQTNPNCSCVAPSATTNTASLAQQNINTSSEQVLMNIINQRIEELKNVTAYINESMNQLKISLKCTNEKTRNIAEDIDEIKYQLITHPQYASAESINFTTSIFAAVNEIQDDLLSSHKVLQNMNSKGNNLSENITVIVNEIKNQLSKHQYTSEKTRNVSDSILATVNEIQNDLLAHTLSQKVYTSCKDVKSSHPNSISGYYDINNQTTYCEMETLCNSNEGWTRLAFLNMSDPLSNCPDGFRLYQSGSVRACGRPSGGCASFNIPSNGISYSEVCGRVVGYQYASIDGFYIGGNINDNYIDGVSITQGYPRNHIWSFAVGTYRSNSSGDGNCPCHSSPGFAPPSFVGSHYYCESGNPDTFISYTLYTDYPLWDGGCSTEESTCCSSSDLPWFHRTGLGISNDNLELRVCCSGGPGNEDPPVSLYEIYVK